jgi:bifunctional ADP-heptose synthase (sugar kinase/adenylyltransferase)
MRKKIRELVQTAEKKRILVIGDTIIDKSTYCDAVGLSLESPTLKAQFIYETISLGGAANIAQHLNIFGADCFFLTNIINTGFKDVLSKKGINLVENSSTNFLDTIKHRFYVKHGNENYKYFQLNTKSDYKANQESFENTSAFLNDHIHFDAIAFSDYRCGFIDQKLIELILGFARSKKIPVYVASQVSSNKANYTDFTGADYFSLNLDEYNASEAFKMMDYKGLYITLGNEGSKYITKQRETSFAQVETTPLNIIGAGDAFYAAVIACCEKPEEAAELGNLWARLTIEMNLGEFPCLNDLK